MTNSVASARIGDFVRCRWFWSLTLAFLALSVSDADAEVGRVMSVESSNRLMVVGDDGKVLHLQLIGIEVPSEEMAREAQLKQLREMALSKVVRFEVVAGDQARFWLGAEQLNDALSARGRIAGDSVEPRRQASVAPTHSESGPAALAVSAPKQSTPDAAPARSAPVLAATPSSTSQAVRGNRQEGTYQLSRCPGYSRISERNRVEFDSASAAERAGFRLAGNCPAE